MAHFEGHATIGGALASGFGREYECAWLQVTELQQRSSLHLPRQSVATLLLRPHDRCLVLYRHRFITNSWGYEIPAGALEAGEDPTAAAAREVLEETGYSTLKADVTLTYAPDPDLSDQRLHLVVAQAGAWGGPPVDGHESVCRRWIDRTIAQNMLWDGRMCDGITQIALAWWLVGGIA